MSSFSFALDPSWSRAFHELGEDGVIEAAPDSDDMGDETSDEDGIEDDPADEESS